MIKIYMSEFEICQYFKFARNKADQVVILSELNLVKKEVILDILAENGVDISLVIDRFGGEATLRRAREEVDQMILQHYDKVGTIRQISELTGYSYNHILMCIKRLKEAGKITEEMENKHNNAPKYGGRIRKTSEKYNQTTERTNNPTEIVDEAVVYGDSQVDSRESAKKIEDSTPEADRVKQISENEGQLKYQSTYERIEEILRLKNKDDSDEIKQGFSELAITIFRDALNNDK